jgi:hypothetical protein
MILMGVPDMVVDIVCGPPPVMVIGDVASMEAVMVALPAVILIAEFEEMLLPNVAEPAL